MKRLLLIGTILFSLVSCRNLDSNSDEMETISNANNRNIVVMGKGGDSISSNSYEIENTIIPDEDPKSPPRK